MVKGSGLAGEDEALLCIWEAQGLGKGSCFIGSDSLPGEVISTGACAPRDRVLMGLSLETTQLLVVLIFLLQGRTWPSFPVLFYYL